MSVVSAGTGLGQAFLVPEKNSKYIVMDPEGGHCDFPPRNELKVFLSKDRFKKYLLETPVKVVMDEFAPLLEATQYVLVP